MAANNKSIEELIAKADEYVSEERLLQAARILRTIEDDSLLTVKHKNILSKAVELEKVVEEFTSEPGPEWKRHYEKHKGFDIMVYFKVDQGRLTARCETPIDPSLLVPLLSVFNETELFSTWLPRWEVPVKLGVRETSKLQQDGRVNQRMKAITDIPWPMAAREAIIDVVAVDEIETNGVIVVRMSTPDEKDETIPEVEEGCVRIDFDGGLVFKKCPKDHPALLKSMTPPTEEKVLCGVSTFVDAKVSLVPVSLINFVTKTVIGRMWAKTLCIAEDVREGKRPDHTRLIEERREVYDWVARRVDVLLEGLEEGEKENEVEATPGTEEPAVLPAKDPIEA